MLCTIIIFFLFCYIVNRLTCGGIRASKCLVGKTAIVTGGNSGIGYQVCLNLASRGCRVIIADVDESTRPSEEIKRQTNNPNIILKKIDLNSFRSIRSFCTEILKTEEKLDILVNNAGVCEGPSLSEDGFDYLMQINYYGPFLLTHLLTGLLVASGPSRIVWTSSVMSFLGNISPKKFGAEDKQGPFRDLVEYSNSKLATIMASDIFAKKLKGTGVTSNSLHPGMVSTPIFSKLRNYGQLSSRLIGFGVTVLSFFFGKDAFEGAATTTHCAVSEELDGVSGEFFSDCRPFFKPLPAGNKELCEKIWDMSIKCVNLSSCELKL